MILSVFPEEQYAVRVLRAGASAYLNKDTAAEELLQAIRTVAAGKKYITSSLAEKLADYVVTATDKPPHEALSDREYAVFFLLASGKTIKAIAEELGLSASTVSTYRSRVLVKLKMRTNSALTYYALKKKLIE